MAAGRDLNLGCVPVAVERLNRREFTEIFEIKYFDRDAYLAQSPQFYKEHGVAGLVVRYQLSY